MMEKQYLLLSHSFNGEVFYYGDDFPAEAMAKARLYERWFDFKKIGNVDNIVIDIVGRYTTIDNYVAKLIDCINKSTTFIVVCETCIKRVEAATTGRTCKQVVNMYTCKIYPSARALAAECGLKLETIYQRLKRFRARNVGTIEDAIYSIRFEFTDKVYPCYLDSYRGPID